MSHCSSPGICWNKRQEMFMLRQEVQVKGGRRKALVLQRTHDGKANITNRKPVIATGNQTVSVFGFYRRLIY
jgi:hypothetical protein